MLEDGSVRPNEFKVYCEQCHEHHPVHNQDPQTIIFVTEDWELAKGSKSHLGELQDPSFRDRLLKAGITASETVHIELVDVRDWGAFADNMTWLATLISRECNCQCFILWNVGTSFLLSGRSVEELFDKNKSMESFVTSLKVKIRNAEVDVRHKFVLVPLVYNKETCSCDFQEMEKERFVGNSPVAGHSLDNFLAYNALVNKHVKKSYPQSQDYLVDPNKLLAVETLKTIK